MKRVLIVKLWALGDILMATPLLTALKSAYPEIHITWIVDAAHADILAGHPLIDKVIPLDSRGWRLHLRRGNVLAWLRQGLALNRQMHRHGFDAVINCHPEKWWSRWLCAAPLRIGLYPGASATLSRFAYTSALPKPRLPTHNTDRYLSTAEALGVLGPFDRRMRLTVSEKDRLSALSFLTGASTYQPGKPLIILHPGASQPGKCWSAASFAAVADGLQGSYNIVITGSPGERILAGSVAGAMRYPTAMVAAGLLSIGQTAALAAQAAAVVTGDTSLLHIASALETPLVGIYLSTKPGDNAPLFGPHQILIGGGQHEVTAAKVLAALQSLLKETHEYSPLPKLP